MKPTIMDGEKNPTVVVQTPVVEQPPAPKRPMKKYVIVGVTAVLVTALLTAGFITTALLFSKTNAELIKSTMKIKDALGNEATEEVEADLDHNTATFTVEGKEGKTTIVHDYNKKLSVSVFHEAKEPYCLVHFLNTTSAAKDEIADANNPVDFTERTNVTLVVDVERVHDTTFLPAQAQTLCEHKPTYWATERYGEVPQETEHGRTKRLTHVYVYSHTVCYISTGRCYHVYRYSHSYK